MNKLKAFIRLSLKNKLLVLRIFILLPYYKCKLIFVPVKKIVKKLITDTLNNQLTEDQERYMLRVAFAVKKISNMLPMKSTCLEKALVLKYLLKEENIPSVLFLGAKRSMSDVFEAHAWLSCNGQVLIGEEEKEPYSVVGEFH